MTNTTLHAWWTHFYREIARGDCALQFTYTLDSASTATVPRMLLRFQPETGTTDYYDLYFQETDAKLARIVGGSWSQVAFNSVVDSDPDTAYTVQIRVDGDMVSVWRSEGSGAAELVFEERDLPLLADARLRFYVAPDTKMIVDDITYAVVEPEHTEYRYNDANELENFVTNIAPAEKFTYDEWGRTITKSRVNGATTYEAVYMYRYGDKLKRVDSTFPNEKDVAYVCDGLGKRRIKSVDPDGTAEKTLYRWAGWSVLAEYGEYTGQGGEWNTFGERTRTYLGASEVLGSNPQTGTYQYALSDHLGSVRQMRGQDKTLLARHAYYSYGMTLHTVGLPLNRGFTGHQWEPETGQYFAPFRYYNPSAARWTMRDPLGYVDGENVYAYVMGNPVRYVDPNGLSSLTYCQDLNKIILYDDDFREIDRFPAANNTARRSRGPWPVGERYPYVRHTTHPDDANTPCSRFGSCGNLIFDVPERCYMGVHSGRKAGSCGTTTTRGHEHPTMGCIRTTDSGMCKILETHKDDPLEHINVREKCDGSLD